jgi:hypothetical protein
VSGCCAIHYVVVIRQQQKKKATHLPWLPTKGQMNAKHAGERTVATILTRFFSRPTFSISVHWLIQHGIVQAVIELHCMVGVQCGVVITEKALHLGSTPLSSMVGSTPTLVIAVLALEQERFHFVKDDK